MSTDTTDATDIGGSDSTVPLDAVCRCGHRKFEHCWDGCVVRQMYGARYHCDCEAFTP